MREDSLLLLVEEESSLHLKLVKDGTVDGIAAHALSAVATIAGSLGAFEEDPHNAQVADDGGETVGITHLGLDFTSDLAPLVVNVGEALLDGAEPQGGVNNVGLGAVAVNQVTHHLIVAGVSTAEGVHGTLKLLGGETVDEEVHGTVLGHQLAEDGGLQAGTGNIVGTLAVETAGAVHIGLLLAEELLAVDLLVVQVLLLEPPGLGDKDDSTGLGVVVLPTLLGGLLGDPLVVVLLVVGVNKVALLLDVNFGVAIGGLAGSVAVELAGVLEHGVLV